VDRPPPAALRAGGDKLAAKETAARPAFPSCRAGTPEEIGFPLLVKAAAGGGGRGMRVVRDLSELDDALDAARREARAAFGDDTVFCERYLERPAPRRDPAPRRRHGNVVALGERDCSIQRRHQKVLEESPSPALDPSCATRMSDAAVAFARAIGYESAGTAEFVLDGRDFFFLELNARIQVEHPVTELVPASTSCASSSGSRPARPCRLSEQTCHLRVTRSRCGCTRRIRARSCRRRAARAAAAAGGRPRRLRRARGRRDRHRVRPDDREAHRGG
jgi:hypothetical protein